MHMACMKPPIKARSLCISVYFEEPYYVIDLDPG